MINAPAEDAWVVVGERFGDIGEWASAITESVMDGPPAVGRVRTCQVAGFGPIKVGVITERLIQFDPEAKSLAYQAAAGMPWFIAGAVGMAGFEPAASCSQSRRANQAAPHPADRSVAYRPGCYRLVRSSSRAPNARRRYLNG